MSTSFLLWGLVFSTSGLGFFIYGKKQKAPAPMLCGVGLMIYPYFVSSTMVLVMIGVVLMAIPWFFRA